MEHHASASTSERASVHNQDFEFSQIGTALAALERSGRLNLLVVGIAPEVLAQVDPFNLRRCPTETTHRAGVYISSLKWRVHWHR